MNVETVREYCLNKKGVTESFPFDDVSLVVKVMNKMFALIDLEEANHIALKCDPEKAIELREHYSGIEGAYHFNKKYWNSVRFESDVDDKLMKELIDHSYDEVIKKFTKKLRAEYDIFPVPLIHISETNSTNNYLQSLCSKQKVEELTVVVADFQTSGRGQRGNSWESDSGKNLLFSIVIFPEFLEARRQFLISQIISLAIKEELDTYTTDISIKWPNDIYWKEKKICGMLIENDLMGRNISQSIAGIGININQETFHSFAPNPVSLRQITGKEFDLFEILKSIVLRIQSYYSLLKKGNTESIVCQYEMSLFKKEGMHRFKDANGEFLARIICVEPEGRLILEDEILNKRGYMFKEVEYLLK